MKTYDYCYRSRELKICDKRIWCVAKPVHGPFVGSPGNIERLKNRWYVAVVGLWVVNGSIG